MSLYCIWFHCIVLHFISLNCMLLHSFVFYSMVLHGIACHFIVLYGIAWYCIVFVFFARHRTVMYRCNSAPANYRVVHLVILSYMQKNIFGHFCLFGGYENMQQSIQFFMDGHRCWRVNNWFWLSTFNSQLASGERQDCPPQDCPPKDCLPQDGPPQDCPPQDCPLALVGNSEVGNPNFQAKIFEELFHCVSVWLLFWRWSVPLCVHT